MKRSITFLLTFFLTVTIYAQEQHLENLKIEGNGVTWQKTYVTVLSIDQMKEKFAELMAFESVDLENDDKIIGQGKPIRNGFVEAGYSDKNTEKYLVERDLYGELKVEFQEGKYRVTLSDIKLRQRSSNKKVAQGDIENLRQYAYDGKKEKWESGFVSNGGAKIVNTTLLKAFDIGGKFDGQDF